MDVSPSYGHICILWRYISYPSSCVSVSSELVTHNCVLQLGSVDLCSTWDPAVSMLGPQSKPGQLTVLAENTEESTSQKQPLAQKRKAKSDEHLIFFSPRGDNSEAASLSHLPEALRGDWVPAAPVVLCSQAHPLRAFSSCPVSICDPHRCSLRQPLRYFIQILASEVHPRELQPKVIYISNM